MDNVYEIDDVSDSNEEIKNEILDVTKSGRKQKIESKGQRQSLRNKRKRESDDEFNNAQQTKRRSQKVVKKEKVVEKLCKELGIADVEVYYSEEDFENWTIQRLFDQYMRPRFERKNLHASLADIQKVLDIKWKEFAILNPYISKVEDDSEHIEESEIIEEVESNTIDALKKITCICKAPNKTRERESCKGPRNPCSVKNDKHQLSFDYCPKEGNILKNVDSDEKLRPSSTSSFNVMATSTVFDNNFKRKILPKDRIIRDNDTSDEEFEHQIQMLEKEEDRILQRKKDIKSKRRNTDGVHPTIQQSQDKSTKKQNLFHKNYCEVCEEGGEIMLCDSCPRAFHLVCLDPELEEAVEGNWSCSYCEKEGVIVANRSITSDKKGNLSRTSLVKRRRKAKNTEENDEHQDYCNGCKKGSDLIYCSSCPVSYHFECLYPALKELPDDSWECPCCTCAPLKAKVHRILTWRWMKPPENKTILDYTLNLKDLKKSGYQRRIRQSMREFFVKYHDLSYWNCDWVTEIQLQVYYLMMLRMHFLRNDMEEPPAPEDGNTYKGRARETTTDPHNLEERFFKWGIRPEWLQIHRVINHKTNKSTTLYLVKWKDLTYEDCTWEQLEGDNKEVMDMKHFVEEYTIIRMLFSGDIYKKKNKEQFAGISKEVLNRRFPPDSPITDLKKKLTKQPTYVDITGGQLHQYQLEGLNWLRFSFGNSVDTILADEMGLGKTIQTIIFLYSLYKEGHSKGPFLVAAPLSTIINWEREFKFWAPDFYVVTYIGQKDSISVIRQHEFTFEKFVMQSYKHASRLKMGTRTRFHVLLTNYERISMDSALLDSIEWEVLVVDEAHRLKNNQSKFFKFLSQYKLNYKLLLTGTPLQNNLEELFNLLNFMTPDKFCDMQGFLDEFADISKEEQVKRLHEILGEHLLRRLKCDVQKDIPEKREFIVRVELHPMQVKFYKYILTRNFGAINAKGYGERLRLITLFMNLRKCCNHPYLFPSAAKDAPRLPNGAYEGQALIKACGKLELLSKMLPKLRSTNHRVLIFSQMTRLLDILEDFLDYMGYKFERIDGAVTGQKRQDSIDRFNDSNSSSFIFLLSTRAGGLGINLATADTVIIYDSDWNPHNDIQAFSRAHRIGQTNKVMIYRFVTRSTVEEKMIHVAKKKMMLNHLVVRSGFGDKDAIAMSKNELDEILKFGTQDLFKEKEENDDLLKIVYDDNSIDNLLDRSQQGIEEKAEMLNDYLSSFKVAHFSKVEVLKDEEDGEQESKGEVIKQDINTSDPKYWEKLLRDHCQQDQEDSFKSLGKGKRNREKVTSEPVHSERLLRHRHRQVQDNSFKSLGKGKTTRKKANYTSDKQKKVKVRINVFESDHDTGSSNNNINEDDEVYYDESREEVIGIVPLIKRESSDSKLPPLLTKVNGEIEVFGFNIRQRKAFISAVMRYGLPPIDFINSVWEVRELKCKSERVMRAYINLFLSHLCEPEIGNRNCYSDGVPREGVSRQHILSRIGIMAIVRKKVQEFEKVNGEYSMAIYAPKTKNDLNIEEENEMNIEEENEVIIVKENKVNIEEENKVNVDEDNKVFIEKENEVNIDEEKKVNIEKENEVIIEKENELNIVEENEVNIDAKKVHVEYVTLSRMIPDENVGVDTIVGNEEKVDFENIEDVKKESFRFNIADGGFTELHTIWQSEQQTLVEGQEHDMWHRRHDYWLLAGVVAHGYGRWQNILNDVRFSILNKPFNIEQEKPNYLDIKNRFLISKFKLLEQALTIEEQLRRAAQLNLISSLSDPIQILNKRFTELEYLCTSHEYVYTEAVQGNTNLVPVLRNVLTQMEDLLSYMKQDVAKLPASLARLPPVSQRLDLTQSSLIRRLTVRPCDESSMMVPYTQVADQYLTLELVSVDHQMINDAENPIIILD